MIPLDSSALLYGFYLNELLIRLLAREDPHQGLFEQYVRALTRLATSESAQTVLRIFELALLKETGVAADLSINAKDRRPVEPEGIYVVDPENGPRSQNAGRHGAPCFGQNAALTWSARIIPILRPSCKASF